jgi:hypothetical protein
MFPGLTAVCALTFLCAGFSRKPGCFPRAARFHTRGRAPLHTVADRCRSPTTFHFWKSMRQSSTRTLKGHLLRLYCFHHSLDHPRARTCRAARTHRARLLSRASQAHRMRTPQHGGGHVLGGRRAAVRARRGPGALEEVVDGRKGLERACPPAAAPLTGAELESAGAGGAHGVSQR